MKTKLTLDRPTVQAIVEAHVRQTLYGTYEVTAFNVHRNGSIDVTVKEAERTLGCVVTDGCTLQFSHGGECNVPNAGTGE